jgi:hypothetical protein
VGLRVGVNGACGGSAVVRARGGGPAFYRRPTIARAVRELTMTSWSRHGRGTATTRGGVRRLPQWSGGEGRRGAAAGRATRGAGVGPGRRFGEGDPTTHGPAGGSPPRRPGPAEPRRGDARRRRGRTLWRPVTKLFELAHFDQVLLKILQLKCHKQSIPKL